MIFIFAILMRDARRDRFVLYEPTNQKRQNSYGAVLMTAEAKTKQTD